MRMSKIVCTMGPNTSDQKTIEKMLEAGMNVARLNMSHGTVAEKENFIKIIRAASKKTNRTVAILTDLQGPKIRLGNFEEDKTYYLKAGDDFTITTNESVLGNEKMASVTYDSLTNDVKVGEKILINDGRVSLRVKEVGKDKLLTKVVVGGPISNHKGLNLPDTNISAPVLTEKDEKDLAWICSNGDIDFVSLSFVRSPSDYDVVLEKMHENGTTIPVMAKIEKPAAVNNLKKIIEKFDAIMVARGDLGVEIKGAAVPLIQREAVKIARRNAKPIIIATQALESMVDSLSPTRAEISDVANSVLEGATATMTSEETSVGTDPVNAVRKMAEIAEYQTEHGIEVIQAVFDIDQNEGGPVTTSAVHVAEVEKAKYIVPLTTTGNSVNRVARLRPKVPIIAFASSQKIANKLALSWGVQHTYVIERLTRVAQVFKKVDEVLKKDGQVKDGDKIVLLFGTPTGTRGTTNTVICHEVGTSALSDE